MLHLPSSTPVQLMGGLELVQCIYSMVNTFTMAMVNTLIVCANAKTTILLLDNLYLEIVDTLVNDDIPPIYYPHTIYEVENL